MKITFPISSHIHTVQATFTLLFCHLAITLTCMPGSSWEQAWGDKPKHYPRGLPKKKGTVAKWPHFFPQLYNLLDTMCNLHQINAFSSDNWGLFKTFQLKPWKKPKFNITACTDCQDCCILIWLTKTVLYIHNLPFWDISLVVNSDMSALIAVHCPSQHCCTQHAVIHLTLLLILASGYTNRSLKCLEKNGLWAKLCMTSAHFRYSTN